MDDQIQDTTVNENVPAENVAESSTAEQTPAQPEATPEADQSEGEQPSQEQPEQQQPDKPRNNAQSRIKELLGAKKEAESERDRLAEMLQQPQQYEMPDELSADEYRALQFNSNQVAQDVQSLKRELAYKDLSSEMDNVVSSVPELNPESDKYNPALEEIIASTYNDGYVVKDQRGNFVGTKKSFKEFAQAHVNAFREAETRGATHGQQVTRQQQSEAAVTPQSTTNSSGPKDFKDLSISEMEAKLGIVHN